jgi:hypothetical protein
MGKKLVSRENGRSVSQIVASARILGFGEEPGKLEINTVLGKLARILECQPGRNLNGSPPACRCCFCDRVLYGLQFFA